MLAIVRLVCHAQAASPLAACFGALDHDVANAISMFLLDLYHIALTDSVQMHSLCCLQHQLCPDFGHQYSPQELADLVNQACSLPLHVKKVAQVFDLARTAGLKLQYFQQNSKRPQLLPLNLAALHGQQHTVQYIVANHPELVADTACAGAARKGHLDILRFLHTKGLVSAHDSTMATDAVSFGCDQSKSIQVLAFLWEIKCIQCVECVLERAVLCGAMRLVEWLERLPTVQDNQRQPLVCDQTSMLPRDLLRKMNPYYGVHVFGSVHNAMERDEKIRQLVGEGGLEALQWLKRRWPEIQFDQRFLEYAVSKRRGGEDLELVKWMIDEVGCAPESLDEPVACGNLETVKYLHERYDNELECHDHALEEAIACKD